MDEKTLDLCAYRHREKIYKLIEIMIIIKGGNEMASIDRKRIKTKKNKM